jgi:hypothetical protein
MEKNSSDKDNLYRENYGRIARIKVIEEENSDRKERTKYICAQSLL